MPLPTQHTLLNIFACIAVLVAGVSLLHIITVNQTNATNKNVAAVVQVAAANVSASSTSPVPTSPSPTAVVGTIIPKLKVPEKASNAVAVSQASSTIKVVRIQKPYTTTPLSFTDINTSARAAMVNILCGQKGGTFNPISGTGVIIDPRGVILTNAHVAQYVLLSEDARVNLSCVIRTGSPAMPRYTAEVLFIPSPWVQAHASELNTSHPMGTGEHDYAFLRITGTVNGSSLPTSFPYLSTDTREAIAFQGDSILGAAYPAEFVGGIGATYGLNAVSSISTINQLLTFKEGMVDLTSIGGVIEAQGGSSGGPVVNAWGRLVGIIVTTSDAASTANRDLRALTLSYINRDLQAQTGFDLTTFLEGDLAAEEAEFNTRFVPRLIDAYKRLLDE